MFPIENATNLIDCKVLPEANTTRSIINRICKRQATFFGHAMKREKLEYPVTTGMVEGKRSWGK